MNVPQPIALDPLGDQPLVSILVTNYNYGRYLPEAIESALNQTYKNIEVIIVDDGSTDNSREIIESYARNDSRVKYLIKENGGQASALNAAFSLSKGEILALLDADDVFYPRKIAILVEEFRKRPDYGFIVHRMRVLRGDSDLGIIPIFTRFESGYIADKIYKRGGRWRHMPASAIAMRRQLAEKIFPIYEETFRSLADAYIFTIAPILTKITAVSDVLSVYRLHEKNITGGATFTAESIRKTVRDIEKVNQGANTFLEMNGLPTINLRLNLNYVEQAYFLNLVEMSWPTAGIVKSYFRVCRLTIDDDLYGKAQKAAAIIVYTLATMIPRRYRPAFLLTFVGVSPVKQFIKNATEGIKRAYRYFRLQNYPQ